MTLSLPGHTQGRRRVKEEDDDAVYSGLWTGGGILEIK
jgi:hypothetical protein